MFVRELLRAGVVISDGKLLDVGDSPVPDDLPAPELAAFTMLANQLMNTDEVLNK